MNQILHQVYSLMIICTPQKEQPSSITFKTHNGQALDHGRLIRPRKKSGRIFCVRQVYFKKSCQQNLGACKPTFLPFVHHIWGETVLWGTVFIIQTSDNRMQYFTILRYKLLFRTIEARVGFSRKPLKKFSKSSIRPAGSDFCSASGGECLNEHWHSYAPT